MPESVETDGTCFLKGFVMLSSQCSRLIAFALFIGFGSHAVAEGPATRAQENEVRRTEEKIAALDRKILELREHIASLKKKLAELHGDDPMVNPLPGYHVGTLPGYRIGAIRIAVPTIGIGPTVSYPKLLHAPAVSEPNLYFPASTERAMMMDGWSHKQRVLDAVPSNTPQFR
ncbi:MAG: hypothetical protein AAFX06_29135 [Planctomycetota bacterium]